jgi:RNA polymerase sigma-70 factor (ECF subfamily)
MIAQDEIIDIMDSEAESAVFSLIAKGDEVAFAKVVKKYWRNVYLHALIYMKSGPLAEEVTQDIFMRVWDNRFRLTKVNRFENYLFILSRNYIVSALRKKLHQTIPLSEDLAEEPLWMPDRQAEYRETYQCLLRGIGRLPEKRKKVFIMSRLEGKTHEEIAAELGINKDTVSQYIVKALISLRTYMYEKSSNSVLVIVMLVWFN